MTWCKRGIWLGCVLLFSTLLALSLSDKDSDEKSYCTAENCDTDAEERDFEYTEDESESEVHLAYNCASPNFVPEEEVPVIFLHGLSDSRRTWEGIYQNIPILTHRKACVYDARNHGDSGWDDTHNVDALAEDLGRLMNKLKIEKAVLVGHSMGGLTAMKFALLNPNRVDSLYVEDISPIGIGKEAMDFVVYALGVLEKSVSVVPEDADEDTAKKTILDYVTEVAHIPVPENFAKRFPIQQRDGVWKWKANYDAINEVLHSPESLYVRPQGIFKGKAMFIYGKSSVFNVAKDEEAIRRYFPNADFFGVEGAGHDIHSEHNEFVTELIKFLE